MVNNVVDLCIGLGIGAAGQVIWPMIKGNILKTIAKNTRITGPYIRSKIKDTELQSLIIGYALHAQKYMRTESGKAKFEWVKHKTLLVIPDLLDPYVDDILQGIYEMGISANIEP